MKPTFYTALILLTLAPSVLWATTPKISNARTCDKISPIGVDSKPWFGWFITDPDRNEIQSAYQVLVSSSVAALNDGKGEVWNSGKINSRLQNYIAFGGAALEPGKRYYWKVRVWDRSGNAGPYSATARFDTGLFGSGDWNGAKWIKRNTTDGDDYTCYRKTITLPAKTVRRAIAYVSAEHTYELFAGGKPVGKGASFHYPQYAYYQAYDLTRFVKSGAPNTFAALVHWYGGGQGRAPGARGFLAKIVIEFTDGTNIVTGTGSGWKQHQADSWITGQPRRNGEGVGFIERIDSRKFMPGWNLAGFDDSTWESAVEIGPPGVAPWTGNLQPDLTRPVERTIKPVSVKAIGDKKYLIDLGKVYAGMPRIMFNGGNPGDAVAIHGAFLLNADNTVNTVGNQQTNLDYFFILNGKSAVFQPAIYFAYRYLVVENSPTVLTPENVGFVTTHYELDQSKAGFTSSNAMLNNVWELMVRSLVEGTHEDFLDTPTREKGSFLGDAGYQGPPAMATMGDRVMNLRTLLEFLDSQDQYWPDGRLNAVYPNVDGKRDIPDYTQAFLLWIWDYYQQTGNRDFLATNYPKFKKIADYVYNYRNTNTGLIDKLGGGSGPYLYGIIDWPAPMRYGYDMSPDSRTVIDVYAYLDFDIVSKIATELGQSADARDYRAKALAMKDAINAKLIGTQGVYIDGLHADGTQSTHVSQHANMFPLAAGIVPAEHLQAVTNAVKERKMSVGMVSVRMLPEALGKAGEAQHLLDLYTNTSWDGWARTVALGGTMTWEDWNANENGNSMSHPWGAVGLLGIQEYILGFSILKPQHELIQIRPLYFDGRLEHAQGSFPTDKGTIRTGWTHRGNDYRLNVSIPVNVTANIYLPKGVRTDLKIRVNGLIRTGKDAGDRILLDNIGSGNYVFEREL